MDRLKSAIIAMGIPYAHYAFVNAPDVLTYLVYGEDGQNVFRAGGFQAEKITTGTIDLYTRDDTGTAMRTVETELNKITAFAFRLTSSQFETDSGMLHYEWAWSLQ